MKKIVVALGIVCCALMTLASPANQASAFSFGSHTDPMSQEVTASQEVQYLALMPESKKNRRQLKKKFKKKRCSLARQGTRQKVRACVRKKLMKVDPDKDGIPKKKDNCPADENPLQEDTDMDGIGNACDPDVSMSLIMP